MSILTIFMWFFFFCTKKCNQLETGHQKEAYVSESQGHGEQLKAASVCQANQHRWMRAKG